MRNKSSLLGLVILIGCLFLSHCAPKAFVKGRYDDPERENLLTDQWSETDMQKAVQDMVQSLMQHEVIAKASKKPIIMVTKIQNKTSEHIDTQSISDMIRVELSKSNKAIFVDRDAREDINQEIEYQQSGRVGANRTQVGQQVGADYILNGRLDSIVQEAGKDKTVYYKLTLNLTDLRSGLIVWTDYKQLRKVYRKRSIGL